ncbi:hypothetical protein JAAARDRAFT_476260 [Jaapia argillacea MUCL 33604]|uniref:PARP catalytic domain-containing protein n=1 Tax=Jaapia argillacea MUCL 33604 TaxID=933084 RepID=A0A067PDB5_9AGAM|nr:hypothetical protein JAAARDRAFT_476260 [Jaapia argillacea MUCL 33604]
MAPSSRDRLVPLNSWHDKLLSMKLKRDFQNGWLHPNKRKYEVVRIFRIQLPDEQLEPYVRYRSSVERSIRTKFLNSKGVGNETMLFHGTTRVCRVGESDNDVRLCRSMACALCRVIEGSFSVSKCGTRNSFKRFGNGIYTTSCSSKADDYVKNTSGDASCRILLLNRVVCGRAYRTFDTAMALKQPPGGHHSVRLFSTLQSYVNVLLGDWRTFKGPQSIELRGDGCVQE